MVQSGNVMAVGAGAVGDRLEDELSAAAAREAALMLLLREVAAISQAQRNVLEVLGREVISTSEFVETRVGAICGQIRRLLPASLNEGIGKPFAGTMTVETARLPESRVEGSGAVIDHGIAQALSNLITEVQFQDRARQRLQFVTDTLFALAECSSEADRAVTASLHASPGSLPVEFLRFTDQAAHDSLRRVRARVAASVPEGGPEAVYGGNFPADEGVVDLF
jgi:hypothetical protein